jgi:hypothetical protein
MPTSNDSTPKNRGIFGVGDDTDDLPPSSAGDNAIALATRAAEVENIIKTHVLVALSLGLIPLPIFDAVVLTTNQVKMVHALGKNYGYGRSVTMVSRP